MAARTPEGPRRPCDRSPEGLTTMARRPCHRSPALAQRWPSAPLLSLCAWPYAVPRAPPRAPPPRENRPNRPNLGFDFRWCWWFIPYSLPECFGRSWISKKLKKLNFLKSRDLLKNRNFAKTAKPAKPTKPTKFVILVRAFTNCDKITILPVFPELANPDLI